MPKELTIAEFTTLEKRFAYEHAAGCLEGECLGWEDGDGTTWLDLDDITGEVDLHDAVAYLDARHLLSDHPEKTAWVQIRDEDKPLPYPIGGM